MIRSIVSRSSSLSCLWEPPKLQTRLLTSSTFFGSFIWCLPGLASSSASSSSSNSVFCCPFAVLSDFKRPPSCCLLLLNRPLYLPCTYIHARAHQQMYLGSMLFIVKSFFIKHRGAIHPSTAYSRVCFVNLNALTWGGGAAAAGAAEECNFIVGLQLGSSSTTIINQLAFD